MKLYSVNTSDWDVVLNFYDHVIECTEHMDTYARWKKGAHPTKDLISSYITEHAMYLYMDESDILGAMAITRNQGSDYHEIPWAAKLKDDEVAVLHILCVDPKQQGKGIGKQMVEEAIRLAKNASKKAVRLDALASNIPSHHLYEEKGFVYRGKKNLYAENTGWTDFYFYEYLL